MPKITSRSWVEGLGIAGIVAALVLPFFGAVHLAVLAAGRVLHVVRTVPGAA